MFHGSLRAFDATVRAGSIRKASEALGVAPSSVSRHIAVLERQIGTALFERRSDGVDLTHAGELVAEFVRKLLLDYDTLRGDLDDVRGVRQRLVRVASVESIAASAPMSAVHKFNARYPAISFNIRLMPAPAVVEAVREGQCEIGLGYCVAVDADIVPLARIPEPVMLAVIPGHPFAGRAGIGLEELATIPLALPDPDFGTRRMIDAAAGRLGVRLEPILTSNDFEVLRSFVRSGSGAALLPMRAIVARDGSGELLAVPIAEPSFSEATIDVIVLRKRRLPRVLQDFVEGLCKEIASMASAAH
ncbi:MAG TPA: LysR family transcriptional regulator [Sphingomicrobium sp.]|nr:LysR family transcriptional regulator [Sphingomicrobium sp.]